MKQLLTLVNDFLPIQRKPISYR